MPSRIEDYAVIGNCETAALVGLDGSIDWLCLPRMDSPACLAALLGSAEHGRWLLAPASPVRRRRRAYRGDTLVLETELETDEGVVRIIDFMPPQRFEPDVVRIVAGVRGRVPMHLELVLRLDYGSLVPWVRRTASGLHAIGGPDAIVVTTPVALHGEDLHTVTSFTVAAGERVPFILTWHASYERCPVIGDAEEMLAHTERWWAEWADRCAYAGVWEEPVKRSLITLKALTYAPTGGIAAAVTTSLPEYLGGVRNWDYRLCWLRDATYTLYALLIGGYVEEAAAWRDWLVRAVAGAPSQVQPLYGVRGERRVPELELPWLPGYEGSRPVRIGNAAHGQLQLDVFGEVVDVLHIARRSGLAPSENAWRVERALLAHLESIWQQPDAGIWEMRGPARHFTHSKVMVWVAFDRGVRAVEDFGLDGPVERWRALRDAVHEEVCHLGYDAARNTFVQYYGGTELDAALLLLPQVGFLPAEDPRVAGTVAAIERELADGHGLIRRYRSDPRIDGLPPGEGCFLLCTFWLVDTYALLGRREEAVRLFEHLVGIANDVGLLPEEYDPAARRFLGNFPQAFSHVALINTARNLAAGGGPSEDRPRGA